MVGPSKILTVSYGTFSCTLEGFDDPFGTMRGIAEYFRDLAAEDRYFGAEPPTPDADMLHQIAEREVNRRVEARVDGSGVVLRQIGEGTEAKTATPAPAPQSQPESDNSIADKLARLRSRTVEEPDEADQETVEDTASARADLEEQEEQVAVETAPEEPEVVAEPDHGAAGAGSEHMFTETETLADELAATLAAATNGSDKSESTSQRKPVVTYREEPVLEDPSAEDEDEAEAFTKSAASETVAESDEPSAKPAPLVLGAESMTLDAEDETSDEDDDLWAQDLDDASFTASDTDTSDDEPVIARVVKMPRDTFEAAVGAGEVSEIDEVQAEDTFAESEALDEEALDEDDDENILSVLRGDATAREEHEDVLDHARAAINTQNDDDDDSALLATLSKVRQDTDVKARSEKEGRSLLTQKDLEDNGESVERILEVTNSELEETEGTRRRSAIAHLKAAVAATRADKLLSRKRQDDVAEDMITYREDLAKVVKPSHPVSTRHHDESRAKTPTPLVLVSEQRIDEIRKPEPQIAATSASVRPRRISTGNLAYEEDESLDEDENIFASGTQSFARYATEMGANELPDLLEAAAAYTAFVEGQPYFSRPQIMKAVEELSAPDEFTREDGLRSFGMLLRRGKIHKIKPGQFRIDDSSRFKPEGNAEQH